jgi:DNA polymerase elongation subunit (family B)
MDYEYKLFEFNIYSRPSFKETAEEENSSDEEVSIKDANIFAIQMFGINERGEQCSIIVEDYKPFFYVKIPLSETRKNFVNLFKNHIKSIIGNFYKESVSFDTEQHKKLYGFDNNKKYNFIKITFNNMNAYNKVKKIWYSNDNESNEKKLIKGGYTFNGTQLELYETSIPPLLRFFHIQEISPSGWIQLPMRKYDEIIGESKRTHCHKEFIISKDDIISLNNKETPVPYNVMSFDIEASSSHGDFPIPIKSYKKLATNIVDYFEMSQINMFENPIIKYNFIKNELKEIIQSAFGFIEKRNIDLVYPKTTIDNLNDLNSRIDSFLLMKVKDLTKCTINNLEESIENYFIKNNIKSSTKEDVNENDDTDTIADTDTDADGEVDADAEVDSNEVDIVEDVVEFNRTAFGKKRINASDIDNNYTIIDILCDNTVNRENKLNELIRLFGNRDLFPALEGDKVTFIGSTFIRYGETNPYLNHCMVLNSCANLHDLVQYSEIETFDNERDMLIAWTNLVSVRKNPDIIIGYNIFGFDYEFMFRRSQELNCVHEFLQLSKNKDELSANVDYNTKKIDIDRSLIILASGAYDLSIIKMNGRLQIDMLNWFRRTENLTSYKLDYVSGYYIGDTVSLCRQFENENVTRVYTNNMSGLQIGNFIHFEEINHSSDYYKNGDKFKVLSVNLDEKWFEIEGQENPHAKKVKWGLAKDDVSVKDIFRMTNEGPESRAIIAKYCIQDCNLVHYLFNKVDVMTDLIEMSKICSVPMSFLVFRGQGIKLTSYVAKKCREKGTLMPTINKGSADDGYEGAIVLVPKCGLYLDKPIGCGDFASLYPSSMDSENLSPDSKTWSKIFDLYGELVAETGEKNEVGEFEYDNLPNREYVNVTFDTYRYVRKTPKGRAEKVKSGYKICRFVQSTIVDGKEEKAIMPSILRELLKARKDTRKLQKTMDDEFMWNILEKRQLAYKATANSLYGQLGAKTSTFYEPDIAASTTATGRLLLTYAKKVVEECYENLDIDTRYGMVNTKAEYIYGDSVANYTPIYIKFNEQIDILTIEDLALKYGDNNWVLCQELGKEDKEYCELSHIDIETWSERGWTKLHRVIRHALAPHKKMVRILTHTGLVDVTDDHSLLRPDGTEVSPNDVIIGDELLHCPCEYIKNKLIGNELKEKYPKLFQKSYTKHVMSKNMVKLSKLIYCLKDEYIFSISMNNPNDKLIHVHFFKKLHNKKCSDIMHVRSISEIINYSGYVYDLTTENHHFAAGIGNMIVHNTDSVFFTFNLTDVESGEKIVGEKALELSIEIAQEACHNVSKFLKQPHDFEYEKTFMPFCLLSKKRYVGILYETDPKKGKRKEMGIVLKRRDNAPIVKDVYGGVIDILMKEQNLQMAVNYVNSCMQQLINGTTPMDKLIITKSLRSFYKNPQGIAHKVLADRIGEREPGNKPSSGDRVSFVYFVNKAKPPLGRKTLLQGDKIETPTFITENRLPIDYGFYITNQIMKPLSQLFGLVLEELWRTHVPSKQYKIEPYRNKINSIKYDINVTDPKKIENKISKIRNIEVKELIFDKYLIEIENKKNKNQKITNFFKPSTLKPSKK